MWDKALQEAKLNYRMCALDKKKFEHATQVLNKTWPVQDDFASVGVFIKAQTNLIADNPLAKVKTPTLSDE